MKKHVAMTAVCAMALAIFAAFGQEKQNDVRKIRSYRLKRDVPVEVIEGGNVIGGRKLLPGTIVDLPEERAAVKSAEKGEVAEKNSIEGVGAAPKEKAVPKTGAKRAAPERSLAMDQFRDRMSGAWLGQSIGVAYGAPTEFKCVGKPVPDDLMPEYKAEIINGTFCQDDLYVEMTFLDVLDRCGVDVDAREAGIAFANSKYRLWCANHNARNNLRRGIAAPSCGHPNFHPTPYDIDYQIEADFSGIISPGLPNRAVRLGNRFGAVMNYGDGLYAGQFVGAMYAEAYFTQDRPSVVRSALRHIPAESRYAEMVRDTLAAYGRDPSNWRTAWEALTRKYFTPQNCRFVSFAGIDVRLNGAYVLIGYLWGDGDMEKTARIATGCGCDSDCNPASACGVLGASLGASRIRGGFLEKLDRGRKWEFTDYDWDKLKAVSEKLVRQVVAAEGGRVERKADGSEWIVVPVQEPRPNAFVSAEKPGPLPDDVRLSDAEMVRVRFLPCSCAGGQSVPRK